MACAHTFFEWLAQPNRKHTLPQTINKKGDTDESVLTPAGLAQAARARDALSAIAFDACFSSPHARARQTAAIVHPSPVFLDSLRECHLGRFQGVTNDELAARHPQLYAAWRDAPEAFCLDGRWPLREAFARAERAWADVLGFHDGEGDGDDDGDRENSNGSAGSAGSSSTGSGSNGSGSRGSSSSGSSSGSSHGGSRAALVVTHKSMLRAMICVALGLPPARFR